MTVLDGHWGGRGPGRGSVLLQEGEAPLAVQAHGQPAGLEGIAPREFLADLLLEADEALIPVPVDQLLLPAEHARPGGIAADHGAAVLVEPSGSELVSQDGHDVLV